jgi:transposase
MVIKLPQRVATLVMIMGLCLVVYSLGQRQLRQDLAEVNKALPDQRGKPTEQPTLQ